jgi:NAD(P)-dependent dehydrogenase (short-subunit alcohol dehydrogenase family)
MAIDKTALVTGSTDGVGRVVALRLAALGWRVIAHGRNVERGKAIVAEMRANGSPNAAFHAADLSSLAEVRRLADDVRSETNRLHLLVNNAGIGSGGPSGRREESHDGHELRFAVNYLAGFLLTYLLLPIVVTSRPARIVNVSSAGQQPIDFDDVMLTRGYDGRRAYRQSKLAQICFTIDLAKELANKGVTVNCLHPATFMNTTMVRQGGNTPISTVEEGADAIMNLAVSPALEGQTGRYFNGLEPATPDPQALDEAARARLRALSLKLTGLAYMTA